MKKIGYIIITKGMLLITLITFNSCQKLDNAMEVKKDPMRDISQKNFFEEEYFTDEQIKVIGKMHNEYLEIIFKDFNFEAKDYEAEFLEKSKSLKNEIENKDPKIEWFNIYEIKDYFKFLKENGLSETAINILQQAEIMYDKSNTLKQYNYNLDNLRKQTLDGLKKNNYEKTLVLVSLSVFENSAYFWSPVEFGGSGVGSEILARASVKQSTKKELITNGMLIDSEVSNKILSRSPIGDTIPKTAKEIAREVLVADGVSAGSGFVVLGIIGGLVSGPLGWGALALIGGETAIASGWEAINQISG